MLPRILCPSSWIRRTKPFVVADQTLESLQRQEIAAPCGLAMTYVSSARNDVLKKPMSLRGAKRRGNLCQVVEAQNEAARQGQEIAAPYGLAMTLVLSGRLVVGAVHDLTDLFEDS